MSQRRRELGGRPKREIHCQQPRVAPHLQGRDRTVEHSCQRRFGCNQASVRTCRRKPVEGNVLTSPGHAWYSSAPSPGATPNLCVFPNVNKNGQVFRGNDSYSCLVAKVRASESLIPKFIGGSCRASFMTLLCSQAHMKLEPKALCLTPGGCASNAYTGAQAMNIPFNFALPRFPAKRLYVLFFFSFTIQNSHPTVHLSGCQKMHADCAGFSSPCRTTLKPRLTPSSTVTGLWSQTCASNNMFKAPSGTQWSCNSSLNGKPSYPEARIALANLTEFDLVGDFSSTESSSVTNETLAELASGFDTCECPSPLLVPSRTPMPTRSRRVFAVPRCARELWYVLLIPFVFVRRNLTPQCKKVCPSRSQPCDQHRQGGKHFELRRVLYPHRVLGDELQQASCSSAFGHLHDVRPPQH